MPKNNELKPVKLPMIQRWGEKPQTEFKNNLWSIEVEVMNAPSMMDLMHYIPQFTNATWSEEPRSFECLTTMEAIQGVWDTFHGKTLPAALETIGIVFRISGISLQEVTHILRHRRASFSAECSGDKWWTNKVALVPNAVEKSNGPADKYDYEYQNNGKKHPEDFHGRYCEIVEMSKQLYQDMIDSKKVSIMDARYILPRCLETFYYMRMSLNDVVAFIKQRVDKQIQPETDNILAYKMYLELLKLYPVANGMVDIHMPSMHYVKTARTGKATNLYWPDKDSDIFEWNENDFIYPCYRNQMNGTDEGATNEFENIAEALESLLKTQEERNVMWLEAKAGIDNSRWSK